MILDPWTSITVLYRETPLFSMTQVMAWWSVQEEWEATPPWLTFAF